MMVEGARRAVNIFSGPRSMMAGHLTSRCCRAVAVRIDFLISLEGLQGYVLQVLAWLVLSNGSTTSFIA